MVHPAFPTYVFGKQPHRACPRKAVFSWLQSGRRTPVLAPDKMGGAVQLVKDETLSRVKSLAEILGICRQAAIWHWSQAATARYQGYQTRILRVFLRQLEIRRWQKCF